MSLPILYSYRRCPYAIRARMALKYSGIVVEEIEISLKNKPIEMIQASPKGTVPVLVLKDINKKNNALNTFTVIDESLQIMRWALTNHDPDNWLDSDTETLIALLVTENDSSFKPALDRYKYAVRFPEKSSTRHRADGEVFLIKLERLLNHHNFLFGEKVGLADIAIFPFIRQFAGVNSTWFENSPYPNLRAWLKAQLESDLFLSVMQKI